ncbi:S26 family signal peptidase [Actinorhabdospora filicis]|uniref:S26 family signal peptidase n=1 Tax=Actinorhabdospora filicis TaxID=1785913 RepID=A0A9W6WCS5_9ACTN|nr:S26 family signal peptidase [Actinorhabdospora filicis]GLZ80886.1 S26 family signal peptidase [Actinorhabdospora filicis]
MTWLLYTAVAVAVIAAGAAWFVHRRYVAITVEGGSMTPTLQPGDRVLIRRGRGGLQRDQIVVIKEPDLGMTGWRNNTPATRDLNASGWYIKRVVALPGDPMPERVVNFGDVVPEGHIIVIGDHPHSGDSKQHGPCPIHQVLGVVVRRMESRRQADPQPSPGQ